MKQSKVISLSYFIVFFFVAFLLLRMNLSLTNLVNKASSFDSIIDTYNSLQKNIATFNIISYFVLLVIGLWALLVIKKINYISLSLILFIAVTLYNSVNLNKALFILKELNPLEETGYWLMLFIGIFYIIGAVVIAAIGYIAIRNYSKRKQST